MGELYRARDTRHGRTVALRLLPAAVRDDAQQRARFERDAAQAAALSDPHIATLYEIGEDQGELYAAFEFVPGETLEALAAAGPVNPRRAIQLAAQIADALAEGHAHGFVHGALTPDRIIVTPKGAAKVLDFGLAAWSAGAPADANPRSDLVALASLLDLMLRGASAGPTRDVPAEIETILRKARAPDDSYDSAAMLAADLRSADAAIEARAGARVDSPLPRPAPRSSRAGPRVAVALTLAALAVGAWFARDLVRASWRRAVRGTPPPVLVVLPFTPANGSPSYVAAGFARDLAARLGQTPGLQVVGRDLSAAESRRPDEVARRMNAGAAVTGAVDASGGRVRVAVTLVERESGDSMWQGTYERDASETFPLRLQVANDVAAAMGMQPSPTAAAEREAARIVDPAAYDAYLKGREAAASGDLALAVDEFAAALKLDDGLAEAHAAYAEVLDRMSLTDAAAADARRPLIAQSAARAMELAPDLPAANLAAAIAADSLPQALAALRAAIRYDESFAPAYRRAAKEIQDVDAARAEAFRRKAAALEGADAQTLASADPPDQCQVLAAALQNSDRRASADARQRLVSIVDQGDRRDAGPYALRCAVIAAAALGRVDRASALMQRVAADPGSFRIWLAHATGMTALQSINDNVFPWSRVSGPASFAQAHTMLVQAHLRVRAQAESALRDLSF